MVFIIQDYGCTFPFEVRATCKLSIIQLELSVTQINIKIHAESLLEQVEALRENKENAIVQKADF